MNTSYGLETAPNEIKTFLQRLHNYAVVATHLVSYIGRRRIKKKNPAWKKKRKKNGGFDRMKVSPAKKR